MKITKLGHSCLLVEMSEPVNRTVLFDPGTFSVVDVESLQFLDDIIITHIHPDHFDLSLIAKLKSKFPDVRITASNEVVEQLDREGIAATSANSEGIVLFESPHEQIQPLIQYETPQEIGVHYLGKLTHPGDSHSFGETMPVLALPVQAPWGSANAAAKLVLDLRPQYVIPIHDWHWNDDARAWYYDMYDKFLAEAGITFIRPTNGEPFVLDI